MAKHTRSPLTTAVMVALALFMVGCSTDRSVVTTHAADMPTSRPEDVRDDVGAGAPEDEGLDGRTLIGLTEWIRDQRIPIFSFLISRNGRLVYELYTSSLTRDHARHVLGMSALDAPDPPRVTTPEALARQLKFRSAPNRVKFALEQPVLAAPGRAYQYNDVTPTLAAGLIQYATQKSALEFAEESLFRPMGFRNYEWMHQDPSGIDLGGFGLRLRPIDMQKFGVLYLKGGMWRGGALISRSWVERSLSPWNRSRPAARDPDYGWFWWAYDGRSGWSAHAAIGWKGQRIAILPRQKLVVTMTACIEDGSENRVFDDLIDRFVVPSVRGDVPRQPHPATRSRLAALLEDVRAGPSRVGAGIEDRMIPSVSPKGRRVPFRSQL